MAVAAAYDFAIPSPAVDDFDDGERAISVASPLNSAAARTSFYLAKWFDFYGGTYTIKAACDDSAAFLVSLAQNNGRLLFTHTFDAGVVEFTVYIPRGRMRFDVLLNNLSTSASNCYVAFSIKQFGRLVYASNAATWVFDTAPIADADLSPATDIRLTYPLYSVMPNWAGGVTERLEWRTEVMTSEADVEQRRSLRRYARRSFEASFLRAGTQRQRLDSFFSSIGKRECLVPLWHEQYPLAGALGSTLTFPAGTLALREYHVGDLVLVYVNPDNHEILTISASDSGTDTITFDSAPVGSWGIGAKVMPLRVAYVMDAVRFENQTDNVATVQARFEMRETEKWPTPSWGHCSPLFRFPVDRGSAISLDFSRNVFVLDNEIGRPDMTDISERTRLGMRFAMMLRGRAEVIRFRAFLHNARGRAVRFWMPSQMQDISLADDFDGPYFDATNAGFVDYMIGPQESRKVIAIILNTGSIIYRTIVAVTRVGQLDRFFVDVDLPATLKSAVSRVMFVVPVRFDQDGFELQHPVDDSAVVRTTVVLRSTDSTDLDSAEC